MAAPGVLVNAIDPQGLSLTATLVSDPADGTLAFNSDGSFTYTPNSGFSGTDSFAYEASNGYLNSAPATVAISVEPATLTWIGGPKGTGSTGNWTDQQWTVDLPYPDETVNTIVNTPSLVQVTSNQAAYSLAISQSGEVDVGPGAVLSVATNFSISSGGTLSVDPNGAFYTGQTFLVDDGNVSGGPVVAGSYQLTAGTLSAGLGGSGGVNVGGSTSGGSTGGISTSTSTGQPAGTVILSGTNTYAGGTTVTLGTLIATTAAVLPVGTSLVIGAGGTFIFDPTQAAGTAATGPAASVAPASPVVAAPFTAAAVSTASPAVPAVPAVHSSAASDAVFARAGSLPGSEASTHPWAWFAAIPSSWTSSDQNKTIDASVAALDQVLAEYGG